MYARPRGEVRTARARRPRVPLRLRAVPADAFPARLVCPRCRVPGEDGRLVVSLLEEEEAGGSACDVCRRCGTRYPRFGGVRCVPPDLPAFRHAQERWLAAEPCAATAEEAVTLCRGAGLEDPEGEAFRESILPGQYALAHFPLGAGSLEEELRGNLEVVATARRWLERHAAPSGAAAPCLLEAGCGPGAVLHAAASLFPGGALGLDLRLGVLRLARRLADRGEAIVPFRTEGRRFAPVRVEVPPGARALEGRLHLLQGDVLSPPLEAEAFPAVVALSLLDSVPDPLVALGQLDALLAPGGLLLVGTPYSWDARATPPGEWWSDAGRAGGETLRGALAGRHPALPHLRYALLEEEGRAAWSLPGHGRLVHRFFLDLVLARKAG